MKICLILPVMLCLLAGTGISDSFAQGETPGRAPAPKAKPKSKPKARSKTSPVKKSSPTRTKSPASRQKTTPAKVQFSRLSIQVTEPDSRISVTDQETTLDIEDFEFTPSEKSTIATVSLKPGEYTLSVSKDGFLEEKQQLTVTAGKKNAVYVKLQPAVANLTIISNTEGMQVSLRSRNTGKQEEFTALSKEIQNIPLPVGLYDLTATKRGFIAGRDVVNITRAGESKTLIITLKQISVGQLLQDAENDVSSGNFKLAIENLDQVLDVEPGNARANALSGRAYYQLGNPRSGVLLLEALKLGEDIIIPVRIFNKEKNDFQLILGNLRIGRTVLEFTNNVNPELNFSIPKADLSDLKKDFDKNYINHVRFEGKSNMAGKKRKRKVLLYSPDSAVMPSKKETFCPNCPQNPCVCQSQADILYTLIFGWQNKL